MVGGKAATCGPAHRGSWAPTLPRPRMGQPHFLLFLQPPPPPGKSPSPSSHSWLQWCVVCGGEMRFLSLPGCPSAPVLSP